MANQEHLDLLQQGVETWNQWRQEHPNTHPDLSEANLRRLDLRGALLRKTNFRKADLRRSLLHGTNLQQTDFHNAKLSGTYFSKAYLERANLSGADLRGAHLCGADLRKAHFGGANLCAADLREADLREAHLIRANLSKTYLMLANFRGAELISANFTYANLRRAYLSDANLSDANLSDADLKGAYLSDANFHGADLRRADLRGADLSRACLSRTLLSEANLSNANISGADLCGADLHRCRIYAISAWDVQMKETRQSSMIITPPGEPSITVENIEIAQFLYLLLNNQKIRDVIDTITSKVVLILGRFTPQRKAILDAVRYELRKQNYSPVVFDFEKPANRDLTETVSTLAHLARFIIVDLTDPSSAPYEVATIVPHTLVPIQPLLLQKPLMIDGNTVERREFAMFEDLRRRYHWVLPTFRYQDTADLLAAINVQIIEPAEQKVKELTGVQNLIASSETHRMGL